MTGFHEDPDGSVWAEDGSGRLLLVGRDGKPVPVPELADDTAAPAGGWTVMDDRVVKLVDGQVVEDRGPTPWIIKDQPIQFLECANGDLAAGSFYGGLFILHSEGGNSQITVDGGLASSTVLCMEEDAEHTLWVGTTAGLQSVRPVDYSARTFSGAGWRFRAFRAIAPRQEGGIWVGTNKSIIYSYDGETLTGFPSLQKNSEIIRRALFQGRRGVLWMSDEEFLLLYAGKGARH